MATFTEKYEVNLHTIGDNSLDKSRFCPFIENY